MHAGRHDGDECGRGDDATGVRRPTNVDPIFTIASQRGLQFRLKTGPEWCVVEEVETKNWLVGEWLVIWSE